MRFRFSTPGNLLLTGFVSALLWPALPAQALTLVGGNINTTQPTTTFNGQTFQQALPWLNVGQTGTTSAIYLGNIGGNGKYWVLTVHHTTSNGTMPLTASFENASHQVSSYNTVPGSYIWLKNADNSPVDLVLFQLATPPPGLPTLSLQTTALVTGDDLYYVGYGSGIKRWGFNDYESSEFHIGGPDGNGTSLVTDYDTGSSNPNEAQAFNGDSGGAAFYYDSASNNWKLAGVMFDLFGTPGQPNVELTYSLSMPAYGNQVLTAVPEPGSGSLIVVGLAGFCGLIRRRRE